MKKIILITAVLFLFLNAAHPQSAKNEEAISLVKQMVSAQMNFEPDMLEKVFGKDYIEISPVGEIDPRDKAIGFYRIPAEAKEEALKNTPMAEVDEINIRNYKNFSIVIARLTFKTKDANSKVPPRSMRLAAVCQKVGKNWKIVSAQFTGIRPSPPKPA